MNPNFREMERKKKKGSVYIVKGFVNYSLDFALSRATLQSYCMKKSQTCDWVKNLQEKEKCLVTGD